jgi:hypothetical protein
MVVVAVVVAVTPPTVNAVVVSTEVAVIVVACEVAVSPGPTTVDETVPPALSVTTSYCC